MWASGVGRDLVEKQRRRVGDLVQLRVVDVDEDKRNVDV